MAQNDRFPWFKWLISLLILGGLAYAGYYVFNRRVEKPPEYKTTAVARGDLTQVVTATGSLNPIVNVQVGSQISGTIAKIFADFNSAVTNGQVIAQIDPATYQAAVHQAEGDLANAKAALELAQVEAKRAKELRDNKLVSPSDYDKAVATWHQAEAEVKIKEAALERSRVDLSRCTIYAPIDGTVISRNVDVGQTVAASFNTPTLFSIANDLTKMQIDAAVSEADIGEVQNAQKVNFTVDAFPTGTFRGEVTQIRNAPTTNQNVVTYDTVIGVNNSDLKLKPGMTATVYIVVAQRTGVFTIPNSALRFRPADAEPPKRGYGTSSNAVGGASPAGSSESGAGRPNGGGGGNWSGRSGGGAGGGGGRKKERSPMRTVYVLDKSTGTEKAKPVQIKIGISDGISTEVTDGLNEGDQVITSQNVTTSGPASSSSNPFGGGMRRF